MDRARAHVEAGYHKRVYRFQCVYLCERKIVIIMHASLRTHTNTQFVKGAAAAVVAQRCRIKKTTCVDCILEKLP